MSNRKGSQDDNSNIYSSDYIDYRPSSNKGQKATSLQQRFIKIVSLAIATTIILLVLSRFYNFLQTSSLAKFPEYIKKIALNTSTVNSELDELTKQFANSIKDEAPRLDQKTLQEIREIETNLNTANSHLKKVSELLKSESNKLKKILEIDKPK